MNIIKVFIGHRDEDVSYVKALKKALNKSGMRVFSYLFTRILPGTDFMKICQNTHCCARG